MPGHPMGYGGFPTPFGPYPQPPPSIPPYFNTMLEAAKAENEKLNSELKEIQNGPQKFEAIHQKAEGDLENLKKSLLPQGIGKIINY